MQIVNARYLEPAHINVMLNSGVDDYAQLEFGARYSADLVAFQEGLPQSGWHSQKAAYEQYLLDYGAWQEAYQAWVDAGSDPETGPPVEPEVVEEQSPVDPDDIVPGVISEYDKYWDLDLAEVKELNQNRVDGDCTGHILAAWSSNAQRNVSLGLYEEDICSLCKAEVSLALAENKGYIDDIEALNTIQEVDDYVALIQREILLGGRG